MMSADGSRKIKQEGGLKPTGCNSCKYFYITWNKRLPYGCRAMGFISAKLPGIDVLAIEGRDCLSFESKDVELIGNKVLQDDLKKERDGNKEINVVV